VLDLLVQFRHLEESTVAELKQAYGFLRRTENRLQAQADMQVHELPEDHVGRLRLAAAMGFESWDEFLKELDGIRQAVTRRFEAIFFGPQQVEVEVSRIGGVWRHEADEDSAAQLGAVGFADAESALARLAQVRETAYWRLLGDAGRARMDQLLPMVLDAAADRDNPDATLLRLLRVVEAIDRRI